MGLLRGLGRWLGKGLGMLVLLPTLALLPAALIDRGPDGSVRRTLVYAGLAASDPFVWTSARNSLAVAGAVALGSMALGIALAEATTRRRFWGRGPLAALAYAPLAVPPLFGALGLRAALGGPDGTLEGWAGWLALVWVEMACGVPIVAWAASGALRRIDPGWLDAATVAGAERTRAWRDLTWPLVRPAAARAAAWVFTLAILEPGGPLVLGLRRTLAYQAVSAATRPGPGLPQTSAALALLGLILAAAGSAILRAWGRSAPPPPRASSSPARSAAGTGAAGPAALLLLWGAAAMAPASGLLAAATGMRTDGRPSFAAFRALAADEEAGATAWQSLILGLAAGGMAMLVASSTRRRRPSLTPPLVAGIGALLIPGLLEMGADWLATIRPEGTTARLLRLAADGLDPFRAPGVLLAWAVAASRIPALAREDDEGGRLLLRERGRRRRALIDAARALGAPLRQARRDAAGLRRASATGPSWVLAIALAATDTAAALVLAPTSMARPVGAGVLLLADDPASLPRASALACAAIAWNLAALAWFARGRPPGHTSGRK